MKEARVSGSGLGLYLLQTNMEPETAGGFGCGARAEQAKVKQWPRTTETIQTPEPLDPKPRSSNPRALTNPVP